MVMVKKNEITVSTRMEKQDYKHFLLENAYKISTVSTLVGRAALALIITLLVRNAPVSYTHLTLPTILLV